MILLLALLLAAGTAQAQFRPALPGYEFNLPRDHFAHPEFELEWWYYTGNLTTEQGRRFGFELTFFRNAVERDEPPTSAWDVDQLYLAHFAVTDIAGQQFFRAERLNRGGPGLAGADLTKAAIWNGNWQVAWQAPEDPWAGQSLRAVADGVSIQLDLTPGKPAVINGENGVSQKSSGEGKASHYITFTRLNANGSLRIGNKAFDISGTAWMDHEFSSNSLGADQAGWDWLSLQLDDNSELMLYRLRRTDGSTDPYSAGTYVRPDGTARHLSSAEFSLTPGAFWTSPNTAGQYPLQWQVDVPILGLALIVTTPLDAQEIVPTRGRGPTYWEGAIDIAGRGPEGDVSGVGYLEMTGYADQLQLGIDQRTP
jgi:predicted secreted hydrolase